jgi:hypothetical protein
MNKQMYKIKLTYMPTLYKWVYTYSAKSNMRSKRAATTHV